MAKDHFLRRRRRRRRVATLLGVPALVALLTLTLEASTAPSRPAAAPGRLLAARLEPPLLVVHLRPISKLRKAAAAAARAPATPAVAARVTGPKAPPGRPVPVLMYHVTEGPRPSVPYPDLWVSRKALAAQTEALRSRGYHAVTLRQVHAYWHKGAQLPRKPVVLTFDDGYRSNYTNALPVLGRLGWPGVLFLEVADLKKKGFEGISPDQVRAMARGGWEIDAHTITHPDLTTVTPAQLRYEVGGSRRTIRRLAGGPVDFFAYPAGKYDDAVVAAVRRAGYSGAVTEEEGLAARDQGMLLKRIRVSGSDSPQSLLEKVQGGG